MSTFTEVIDLNQPNRPTRQDNFDLKTTRRCDECGKLRRDETAYDRIGWIENGFGDDWCKECALNGQAGRVRAKYRKRLIENIEMIRRIEVRMADLANEKKDLMDEMARIKKDHPDVKVRKVNWIKR